MCEICRRYICPSSCPNADDPEPWGRCEECGGAIQWNDWYYELGGKVYCESCVENALHCAED